MVIPAAGLQEESGGTGEDGIPGFCRMRGAQCWPGPGMEEDTPPPGNGMACHCPFMRCAKGSVPGSPACSVCFGTGAPDSACPAGPAAGAGS